MKAWLAHHAQSCRLAWRRLAGAPLNTLLSLLAIGIALALPAGGQMLLDGARQLVAGSSATPRISVFMGLSADRVAANAIRVRLEGHGAVKSVQFLPKEETLARFKAGQGLREIIEALPGNPFPDAFVVGVRDETPDSMERLAGELRKLAGVDHVQLDAAWVRRLDALLRVGRTALTLLGLLLGTGLVAISFGAIRMQVLTHRNEIEVSRLLGATEAFVRRPFLYHGAMLGLGGGLVAWLIVAGASVWLRAPLADLAGFFDLTFSLQPLGLRDSLLLLIGSLALGWTGAVFSLRQNLGSA